MFGSAPTSHAGIRINPGKLLGERQSGIDKVAAQVGGNIKNGVQSPNMLAATTPPTPSLPAFTEAGSYAVTLTISLFVFSVIVLIAVCFLSSKGHIKHDNLFKIIGLIFVVTIAVFLIPAGYDQAQIAPAVALLGTVTGYLFGKSSDTSADSSKK